MRSLILARLANAGIITTSVSAQYCLDPNTGYLIPGCAGHYSIKVFNNTQYQIACNVCKQFNGEQSHSSATVVC